MPKIYILTSGEKYASYCGVSEADDDAVFLREPPSSSTKWVPPNLVEFLGVPPTKPKRRGDYHSTGRAHYFSERAIDALRPLLEPSGVWLPVTIQGRDERFFRYWITRAVDCLDLERSTLVKVSPKQPNIGVIKRPVFRYDAWDGSDIFRVPGDENVKFFVSERFIQRCIDAKIKGAEFVRESFDDNPIRV